MLHLKSRQNAIDQNRTEQPARTLQKGRPCKDILQNKYGQKLTKTFILVCTFSNDYDLSVQLFNAFFFFHFISITFFIFASKSVAYLLDRCVCTFVHDEKYNLSIFFI